MVQLVADDALAADGIGCCCCIPPVTQDTTELQLGDSGLLVVLTACQGCHGQPPDLATAEMLPLQWLLKLRTNGQMVNI